MVDVDELRQQELETINGQDTSVDDEVYDLESLILEGTEARIPIIVTVPRPDGTVKKGSAKIRPITNAEWNYAIKLGFKDKKHSSEVEVVKNCLYTKDDKPFPKHIIDSMPSGVVTEIANEIVRISGIPLNQEDGMKVAKDILGF